MFRYGFHRTCQQRGKWRTLAHEHKHAVQHTNASWRHLSWIDLSFGITHAITWRKGMQTKYIRQYSCEILNSWHSTMAQEMQTRTSKRQGLLWSYRQVSRYKAARRRCSWIIARRWWHSPDAQKLLMLVIVTKPGCASTMTGPDFHRRWLTRMRLQSISRIALIRQPFPQGSNSSAWRPRKSSMLQRCILVTAVPKIDHTCLSSLVCATLPTL